MVTILGIDPGTSITGFGVISFVNNKYTYITSGHIRTTTNSHASKRLHEIFSGILTLVERYQPNEAAIEQVFMHINVNSALKLGQARGAAIVAVAHADIKVAEYAPRQIKQAIVGYGNAEKQQMQHMVQLLLKLPHKPQTDEADALAIAICHANWRNSKFKIGG